jgi:hypothetical protein
VVFTVGVFLTNTWVVSIITGLIVYVLTKLLETFREKRHYVNTLKLANDEVFNTIKVMIPEDTLPSPKVLFSLHRATAKKYGVKQEDMYVLPTIINSLIKEILDSSFLSYHDKVLYSEKLLNLTDITILKKESYSEVKNNQVNQRNKMFSTISTVFAALSSVAVFILSFLEDKQLDITGKSLANATVNSFNFLVVVLYFIVIILAISFAISLLKDSFVDVFKKTFKKKMK